MQIPTLVESVNQRMLNVVVMKFPRTMDRFTVVVDLLLRQRAAFGSAMWRNRHDVRRAVGQPHAGAGKRDLHHVFREVTRGVKHVLMHGSDVATRGVIVS